MQCRSTNLPSQSSSICRFPSFLPLWEFPSKVGFLSRHAGSVRAVVGNTKAGADFELIDSLPRLEIVMSYNIGLDKIDLRRCSGKGIRVTNTPDVLTDDVADIAIGLVLATLRKICAFHRFARSGLWKKGDFDSCTKLFHQVTN